MANLKLQPGTAWEEVKAKIKEKLIDVTDEDLQLEAGEEKMLEKLSKKINKSKEETRAFVESIAANKSIAG